MKKCAPLTFILLIKGDIQSVQRDLFEQNPHTCLDVMRGCVDFSSSSSAFLFLFLLFAARFKQRIIQRTVKSARILENHACIFHNAYIQYSYDKHITCVQTTIHKEVRQRGCCQ